MNLKRLSALLFPATMALVLLTTAVPASAAPAAPVASSNCPAVVLIGLHGTNEGPSKTYKTKSPEIEAVFKAFKTDSLALGEDSFKRQEDAYPYVSSKDYSLKGIIKVLTTVLNAAGELADAISSYHQLCPDTGFSLVGYSLGAWIINVMLDLNSEVFPLIRAVLLIGDPCWYNPDGPYRGLVRYLQLTGANLYCVPFGDYPYPSGASFPVQSLCNNKDPICGQGWPLADIGQQLKAAEKCADKKCTHLDYVGEATSEGGQFLADNAFGSGGVG